MLIPNQEYYCRRLGRYVNFVEICRVRGKHYGMAYVEWRNDDMELCGWYVLPEDLE